MDSVGDPLRPDHQNESFVLICYLILSFAGFIINKNIKANNKNYPNNCAPCFVSKTGFFEISSLQNCQTVLK